MTCTEFGVCTHTSSRCTSAPILGDGWTPSREVLLGPISTVYWLTRANLSPPCKQLTPNPLALRLSGAVHRCIFA